MMATEQCRPKPLRDPRPVAGRLPPHDLESEAAVLSASLLDADACDEALAILKPECFYGEQHQIIFSAIAELRDSGRNVDPVTVGARLRERELLQRVGGVVYLAQLFDASPAISHIADHARTVWAKWRRRQLIACQQWGSAMGYDDQLDDDRYVTEVDARITEVFSLRENRNQSERVAKTLATVMHKLIEGDDGSARKTGLLDLDRLIGGLYPGDLTIIAGRPGMGKSALLDCIEMNISASTGLEVLSWSGEMPKEQRATRKLCGRARVDLRRFRTRELAQSDFERLTEAGAFIAPLPLEVDDTPMLSLQQVASLARRRHRRALRVAEAEKRAAVGGLALLTGDHLGIMATRDRGNRSLELGELSRGLKALAKELTVPVVWLCQLNRGVESRANKRPTLSDLRESGNIEEDADNVIMIYRDEYYAKKEQRKSDSPGVAELIVEKQRNGPTGIVRVRFDEACARFDNLAPEDGNDRRGQESDQ